MKKEIKGKNHEEQKIYGWHSGCGSGDRYHGSIPRSTGGTDQQPLDYINGATNEYSFRMKEEDRVHEQNVRKIRFAFQRDGDQAKYDHAMKGSRSVTISR